ncbi:MAG TPA: hypothetical protein VD971_09700 [Phycisphaerales bacterium]|nr:hypothetical protein [Phycisphaerales bacterium]
MLFRFAAVLAAGLSTPALANLLTYDPSLGTLPHAQGWTFDGTFNAPMSVSGGQLTYGPTTTGGTTHWAHNPTDALDFSTQTAFIQTEVRLTGAQFGNFSGFRRGGFSMFLEDDFGRWIIADFGDNAISLGNDNTRLGDPSAAFDLTTGFHVLRLEAGPTGGRLLVDGVEMLTLALGSGQSGGARGTWGEQTTLARATMTEVRGAMFIPAPGGAVVALAGVLAVGRRRR